MQKPGNGAPVPRPGWCFASLTLSFSPQAHTKTLTRPLFFGLALCLLEQSKVRRLRAANNELLRHAETPAQGLSNGRGAARQAMPEAKAFKRLKFLRIQHKLHPLVTLACCHQQDISFETQ